jgi:hypothetical protein
MKAILFSAMLTCAVATAAAAGDDTVYVQTDPSASLPEPEGAINAYCVTGNIAVALMPYPTAFRANLQWMEADIALLFTSWTNIVDITPSRTASFKVTTLTKQDLVKLLSESKRGRSLAVVHMSAATKELGADLKKQMGEVESFLKQQGFKDIALHSAHGVVILNETDGASNIKRLSVSLYGH